MEKNRKSCPNGVCEKILKAITFSHAIQAIRGVSHRPQSPLTSNPAPISSTPAVKTIHIQSKPISQEIPKPAEGAKDKEEAEKVHIEFDYSTPFSHPDNKSKSSTPNASTQKNGQIPQEAAKIRLASQIAPADKTKPKAEMAEPSKTANGHGQGQVPKSKPMVTEMAQPGNPLMRGHGQVAKLASRIEPELPVISANDKSRPKAEKTPATKATVVGQNDALGAKAHKDDVPHQINREEGKKPGLHTEDHFTDYINRAKLKIRAMSDVGSGTSSSETENVKDHFSDYIKRAKMKMRTTSTGGRTDSFK